MKIGIFGDSYAEGNNPKSWSRLLQAQYHYDIRNYAWAATSLFWSYQQLEKNIDNVDTIIFVATQDGRLYWPDTADSMHKISTMFTIQYVIKHKPSMNPTQLAVFKAAEQYHLNLANANFDKFVHGQIIKEIGKLCKKRNKRLILIPAFDVSIDSRSAFQCSLSDVSRKELTTQFGSTQYFIEKNTRTNHMSIENNIVFAGIIDKLLRNEVFSIGLDNFVFKKVDCPQLYWQI